MNSREYIVILAIVLVMIAFACPNAEALEIAFTNYDVIDFGEMNLGDIKYDIPRDGLIVKCTASTGTPGWTLTVRIDHPLTHESNIASEIPNTNFKWYLVSTSDLNNQPTNIEQRVEFRTYDDVQNPVYTGLANEDETELTLKFQLEIPRDLEWGYYDTHLGRIVFTLTE